MAWQRRRSLTGQDEPTGSRGEAGPESEESKWARERADWLQPIR